MKEYFNLIKSGKTVKFTELSSNPSLSHNGGSYHYYTVVKPLGNNVFEITTKSSCDFVDDTEESTITTLSELRAMLHDIAQHPHGWLADVLN